MHVQRPGSGEIRKVTLIPGDGIGPEITDSVQKVFKALHVPVEFDILNNFNFENKHMRELLMKNECILLGVLTESGQKYTDNYNFYKHLDLYANITAAFSMPGIEQRHEGVDIVVIRENTEGEYSGIEHEVYNGVIESIKITTKKASLRVAEYAFEFAHLSGRKKVTAVHKANIMKLVDGLFLEACREVAPRYPFIKYEEMIIDNCCMQLVKSPQQFDVMVLPNLYGSIVQNVIAGITGGVGMAAGASIGKNYLLFSQGCRHTGNDIAGKNIVNPSAILISSVTMLRHLGLPNFADKISDAVNQTIV
jgi:isocitrate dehydrogenase (NAD+)